MSCLNVGIVGGGVAGLYAASLLQREGHNVRIFEGTDRIGGRIRTHYFSTEKDQYYEAGAMRIPNSDFHKIVFQLIEYLNPQVPQEKRIDLIKYILTVPGNGVYINGRRPEVEALSTTPASVGWDVPDEYKNKTAHELLREAIGNFIEGLKKDFQKTFNEMVEKFDNYTFRYYCTSVMSWPHEVIDFVETVASQTNQFTLSVPELVMQNMDFDETDWRTIDKGMARLPQAMAYVIGQKNITFGARVTGIEQTDNGQVRITASGYNGSVAATFDRVILAIPPAALRMIIDRPRWGVEKEVAIRSMHFEPLYKMGLRFKTRFWERVTPKTSKGGQSTTDLPIRWIVYPSNGIGEDGPGVLLIYAWMTDASNWLPLSPRERRSLALDGLARMYQNEWDGDKEIDIYDLVIETSDVIWSDSTATGDAMFLPGQFRDRFDVARKPEGNIYFAGEHLSNHHTWISGAANSALNAVRDMLDKQNLPPLTKQTDTTGKTLTQSKSKVNPLAQNNFEPQSPELAKVPFDFRLDVPLVGRRDPSEPFRSWPPVAGGPNAPSEPGNGFEAEYDFPTNLGMSGSVLGADTASLKAHNATEL